MNDFFSPLIRGMILSPVCSYATLNRWGFVVPAQTEGCPRLLLEPFSPRSLNFALKIYDKKNDETVGLCLNGKIKVFLNRRELVQRLHLKESKCTEQELPGALAGKKKYFLRLPKIIEQAQKLLLQCRAHLKENLSEEAPSLREAQMLTVSHIMKYVRIYFGKFPTPAPANESTGTALLYKKDKIFVMGALVQNNLQLTLFREHTESEKIHIGNRGLANIFKQWHINAGRYMVYKCAARDFDLCDEGVIGQARISAYKAIENEYFLLEKLNALPAGSGLALPAVPHAMYRLPEKASVEPCHTAIVYKLCDTNLFQYLWGPDKSLYDFQKNKKKTLQICCLLIKTLAHAHSCDIVHGGISPHMIGINFPSSQNNNEEAPHFVLCGWGGGQDVSELQWDENRKRPLAYTNQLQGIFSPPSPTDFERISQAQDYATLRYMYEKVDVYGMGCIIYAILTGGFLPYHPQHMLEAGNNAEQMHFCKAPLEKNNYSPVFINLLEEMTHPNYWMRPTAQYAYENFLSAIEKCL